MNSCVYLLNRFKYLLLWLAALSLLASCSTLTTSGQKRSLEEVAGQFAQILNINDVEGHYGLMNPSYHETHTIEQFKTLKRPIYSNVALHSIDYKDESNAIVYYTTDLKIMGLSVDQTRIYFPFELTKDGWYLKQTKSFE